MEKQTRVQKYKNLREEMKEEVAINRHINETSHDEDDDFLAFIPKEEKKKIEDTLMEPLSYETLNTDSQVKNALNEAKINVGKEQYNTRLDILNKIKQEEKTHTSAYDNQNDDINSESTIQEEKPKMTLLEKLAAMSPEEDAEELKKFEEGMTVADLMKSQKPKQKVKVVKEVEDTIEDEEIEKESRIVTVLNGVIIVFIFIFLILIGFIVKQMFF